MDFTIDRDTTDENGDDIIVTSNYTAELDGTVAKVYSVKDDEVTLVAFQPWNPLEDGSRADWNSVDEIVSWYTNNF